MSHPAQMPVEDLLRDCQFRRTRRSGPGGQHRNKVETAVVVQHVPTATCAEANELRSQGANREVAIRRLRVKLALEVRCQPQPEPSLLWQNRGQGGNISVNENHADFPALLSEALDRLFADRGDVCASADFLGVSNSQMVKFLKIEPAALQSINALRAKYGLKKLK